MTHYWGEESSSAVLGKTTELFLPLGVYEKKKMLWQNIPLRSRWALVLAMYPRMVSLHSQHSNLGAIGLIMNTEIGH